MRITENVSMMTFLKNLDDLRVKLQDRNNEISTGKKINRPSDAPVDSAELIRIRDDMSRINQYYRNINQATLKLTAADDALNSMRNLVTKVAERTGYALNATLTQTDRDSIADELQEILDEIVRVAGTRVDGETIFSGTEVTLEPLTQVGNQYVYQGNGQAHLIEIAPREKIQVNVTGEETFAAPGADLVNTMTQLIDQLRTSDLDGARQSLATIDAASETIDTARVQIGNSLGHLEEAKSRLDADMIRLTEQVSKLEDANMAESITQMVLTETAFQAALSGGSRIQQQNLFDFIG